jgi:NADH-quinone oxidoreductase subunit C
MPTQFAMPPLADALPAGSFEVVTPGDDIPTIAVKAADLLEVSRILRHHPSLQFNVCLDVTCVDQLPRVQPRFRVVYHFVATDVPLTLRVRVALNDGEEVPTLSTIWPSCNWQEREVWDLFGIVFTGHPQLQRLLTPDDWEGHPLRKDYPVQVKVPYRTYEPLQLTQEEFRANVEADRRDRRAH